MTARSSGMQLSKIAYVHIQDSSVRRAMLVVVETRATSKVHTTFAAGESTTTSIAPQTKCRM